MTLTKDTRLRVDYHLLALAESRDLFYSGSGPQERSRFGHVGRPSSAALSLADVNEAGFSQGFSQALNQ